MSIERARNHHVPEQGVKFHEFDRELLSKLLRPVPSPLEVDEKPLNQLKSIAEYLLVLGCCSLAVEDHYVDRDYLDDHAAFYSKSLCCYPNSCRRAHFFSKCPEQIERQIEQLLRAAPSLEHRKFREQCSQFSRESYLGFLVIKPLPGCPVGRTVLKGPSSESDSDYILDLMPSMRTNRAHFAGIELEVTGLAFQQQDVGVSACATTAIWSAFQKIRDFEEVTAASPAQITMLAGKYSLPFGRSMPSEGLSTDQMCLAVQALGASPHLLRINDYDLGRGYLYSIGASGMCCILILQHATNRDAFHAVSVVGLKCSKNHVPEKHGLGLDDQSSDLTAILVHDDRFGPYLNATLERTSNSRRLYLRLGDGSSRFKTEKWEVAQILLPLNSRIHLSFPELWELTHVGLIPNLAVLHRKILKLERSEDIRFQIRILLAHAYLEELAMHKDPLDPTLIYQINTKTILDISTTSLFSRYIGVVRLSSPKVGTIDVVVDSTSTLKNPNFLIVVSLNTTTDGNTIARELALLLGCKDR